MAGCVLFIITNRIDPRYLLPVRQVVLLVEKARVCGLRMMGAKIGANSWVRSELFITSPQKLRIGMNTKIGIRSELWLYDDLSIGNDVEIGSGLVVHTAEHVYPDIRRPIAKQGAKYSPVRIGSDVYIGSRVTLLHGVNICDHTIIGAGSVVTSDCESGKVYAGVPARIVGTI